MRLLLFFFSLSCALAAAAAEPAIFRTAQSGAWSSPATWEGARLPGPGERVLIRAGHAVTYDVASETVIRSLHIAGKLSFARDRDTLLCAGLVRIAPGEECTEEGFDCHARLPDEASEADRPVLEVGSAAAPIPPEHRAIIRLTPVPGLDPLSFPALVCCGGRMELHGAPMSRTWVKLGQEAARGLRLLELAEPVTGWKAGDHLLLPTTEVSEFYTQDATGRRIIGNLLDETETEEAEIAQVQGANVLLTRPLKFKHQAEGQFRGEVANLSRNVIVESADPKGARGHTMYHRRSAGSISYAEFRHLGKEGVLGRYPIHFHLCGNSMRGSSVIGASIWDSGNRWLTIHGTDYLVVRDCVGYRGVGHGYFFEDGTETGNIFDRNLAVQALMGAPLPEQNLAFDTNDGAGFWWANCLNSFTRNVAVECGKFGYRFQMTQTPTFSPRLPVRQADGTTKTVDVRTLPFIRFEGNEAHGQRRFGLNLGGFHAQNDTEDLDRDGNVIDRIGYLSGDVQGVGPDAMHPFRIKDFLVWRGQWGFHSGAPNVQIDGFTGYDLVYVFWRSNIAGHDYNRLHFEKIATSTFFNSWGAGATRAEQLRYTEPRDTLPPTTVITETRRLPSGQIRVSGVTADDGKIAAVTVNGQPAELHPGPVTDWAAYLPVTDARLEITATAVDVAGNRELTPHRLLLRLEAPASTPVAPLSKAEPTPSKTAPVREATVDEKSLPWPLWDGRESVTDYAKRTGLETSRKISVGRASIELRLIPAGRFLMGSPADEAARDADETPQHRVVISRPFYLGRYELTQAAYEAVLGENPSHFRGPDRPVEQVSWEDAQRFLQRAGQGLRLPTEAEWEYAARAGTATAFSAGADTAALESIGWYGYNLTAGELPHGAESYRVGQKQANAFGLHDMAGNVYEWCADWYAADYYAQSPVLDPAGPASGSDRVIRGGSWEAKAAHCRSANRNAFSPRRHGYVLGFRLAQSIEVPASPTSADRR